MSIPVYDSKASCCSHTVVMDCSVLATISFYCNEELYGQQYMSTHTVETCVIGIGISLEFRLLLRISRVCAGYWLGTASPVVEPSFKNVAVLFWLVGRLLGCDRLFWHDVFFVLSPVSRTQQRSF